MSRKRTADHTTSQVSGKARKQARKEDRKSKKQRRAVYQKNKSSILENEDKEEPKLVPKVVQHEQERDEFKILNTIEKEMKVIKRQKKKHKMRMVKSREMTIEDLRAGIEDDDAIIRNMERKLGIKKNKKKNELSTSDEINESLKIFGEDQEDELGDGSEKADKELPNDKVKTKADENLNIGDYDNDFTQDELDAFGVEEESDNDGLDVGENIIDPDDPLHDDHESDVGFGMEPSDSDGETDNSDTEVSQAIFGDSSDDEILKNDIKIPKEDDKMETPKDQKYIPPALRSKSNALDRLIRGHLNKLSSGNLYVIVQEFQSIFRNNPRKDVSSSITLAIFNQILQSSPTPILIVEDYSSFIICVHHLISDEITGFFIEDLITKYFELNEEKNIDVGRIRNLISLFCALTRLKLFNVKLIIEVLQGCVKRFSSYDVDLIQQILLQCAFTIRKEAPLDLKGIIIQIHNKVNDNSADLESVGGSRAKFMLEMLLNVKNNNLNAIKVNPGFIESDRDQACKKRIRAVVGAVQISPFAAVGLSDITAIPELGRWWRVGASVTVRGSTEQDKKLKKTVEVSDKLKAVARKMRLNTDNKRNVFYMLNTCVDYVDAATKIIEMNVKGSQRQDVLFVILEIVMRLKKWSMFYIHVLDKLLQLDRSFLMPTQCAYWDKFSVLDKLNTSQIENLGKFLANAFQLRVVPVTMLKKFEFAEIGKKGHGTFFRAIMKELCELCSPQDVVEVFSKLSLSETLKDFRLAFHVFVQHQCVKNERFMADLTPEQAKILDYITRNIKEKDEKFLL